MKTPKKPLEPSTPEKPSKPEESKSAWVRWDTLATIAREAGAPKSKVLQLALREGISFQRCDDGTLRLPPAQAAELKESLGAGDYSETSELIKNASELVSSSVSLVKTAQAQVKDLLDAITQPMKALSEASSELQKKTLARVTELEAIVDSAREVREAMLNEQNERELARRRYEAQEKRKDEAWSHVTKVIPVLGPQLMATVAKWMGAKPGDVEKQALAQQILSSLTKEQVMMLTHPSLDLISAEQKETLRRLFNVDAPEKADKTPSS